MIFKKRIMRACRIFLNRTVLLLFFFIFFSCSKVKHAAYSRIDRWRASIQKYFDPTPKQIFEKGTGLMLSCVQSELVVTDTYFIFEGIYTQDFIATEEQIRDWELGNSPWNGGEWQTSNLSEELMEKFEYPPESTDNIIYSFVETCCEEQNLPFHNGQVLIISVDDNRVRYAYWDF